MHSSNPWFGSVLRLMRVGQNLIRELITNKDSHCLLYHHHHLFLLLLLLLFPLLPVLLLLPSSPAACCSGTCASTRTRSCT